MLCRAWQRSLSILDIFLHALSCIISRHPLYFVRYHFDKNLTQKGPTSFKALGKFNQPTLVIRPPWSWARENIQLHTAFINLLLNMSFLTELNISQHWKKDYNRTLIRLVPILGYWLLLWKPQTIIEERQKLW